MWVKGVIIPSITEWEMHITAQGPRLWNDLYCVKWDVKLYYTIPYHEWTRICLYSLSFISECIWVWFSVFFLWFLCCFCVFWWIWVQLSVPVQVFDWKDSSPKRPVLCVDGDDETRSLTSKNQSLTVYLLHLLQTNYLQFHLGLLNPHSSLQLRYL